MIESDRYTLWPNYLYNWTWQCLSLLFVFSFSIQSHISSLDWQPGLHLRPSLHSKRQRREKTTEQMSTSTYHYIYSSPGRKDRKNNMKKVLKVFLKLWNILNFLETISLLCHTLSLKHKHFVTLSCWIRCFRRSQLSHGIWIFIIHSKYFPDSDWLKSRITHHNQLLMTKFGRILCLTRKWRRKCSVLAG